MNRSPAATPSPGGPAPGAPAADRSLLTALGALLGVVGVGSYLAWLPESGLGTATGGWDFRAYYAAAHALVAGGNLYELGSGTTPFYLYPPLPAFLFLPLALPSDLPTATAIWTVLQHLGLLALGALILALTGGGVPGALRAGLLLFLWGWGVPLRDEIFLGQVNILVWLLLLGALALARPWAEERAAGQGLPRLLAAGLLLGLAISIKVQPIVLLPYFILRGRRRLALAGGLAFVLLQAATIPFTASTLDYWQNLFPDLPGRAQGYIDNQSINGLLARWLLDAPGPAAPDERLAWWRLANWGGALLVLLPVGALLAAPSLAAWRRGAPPASDAPTRRLRMLLEISLLLVSINITSYLTWPHHLLWWVLPALALVGWWTRRGPVPVGGAAALGLVAVVFSRSPNDWLRLADPQQAPVAAAVLGGMHLYALALLWLVLAREVWAAVAPFYAHQLRSSGSLHYADPGPQNIK